MMPKIDYSPEVQAAMRMLPPPRPNKYADPAPVVPMEEDTTSVVPLVGVTFPPLEEAPPAQPDGVILRSGNDLNPQPITWLWRHWLAVGKLQLLAGAPGQGKTTIAMAMAATVTTGGRWPDGSRCEVGNALIWSGEDDPADTLLPRLLAAGADRSRCYFIEGARRDGEVEPFDPARDLRQLQAAIGQIGGVKLLIVDPVVSAVTGDSHKNTEVRRALQPLVDLGTACGCAVVGITHFAKGGQGADPAQRIVGSVAFTAVARVVLVAAKVKGKEGQDARILARAKSNIGPDDGGFEYHLEQTEPMPGIQASYITWGKPVEGSARDLLTDPDEDNTEHMDVSGFLRSLLAGGPVSAKSIYLDAEGAGYSKDQIKRAAAKMGVQRTKSGMNGGWVWSILPEGSTKSALSPCLHSSLPSHPSGDKVLPSVAGGDIVEFEL